jgi:thiamine-phosphate pyrophosphorylase
MKDFELPALYPITDTRISGLPHHAQVEKLIAGGARLIQLREKHLAPKDFFDEAVKAIKIARGHGVKILINDHVDIAFCAGADGVHLGQTDLPPDAAREILGKRAIIGFSTHNLEQAISATQFSLDYIAIGPIFTTKTKENPDEAVGLDNLKFIRQALNNLPLVAIGGINKENAHLCLKAGADSVAVVSAILKNPSAITTATATFLYSATDEDR